MNTPATNPATQRSAVRPNILWILGEDVSPDYGCYGNPDVATPHIDRFAAQGRLYSNAFATAPVCSPARSALITGLYQTSIGAHHHRSHRRDGYRLPVGVQLVPERLRAAGYFCAAVTRFPEEADLKVSGKEDWNFTPPDGVWDSHDWADLRRKQPFFAMINMAETHRPYKGGGPGPRIDPQQVSTLPPYVADHPLARADWAAYLETVQVLDDKVGRVFDLLEQDGLAEETIVFFFADHGREDFRAKASAFDGGTRIPLIVRWPGRIAPGTRTAELVSALDISAATLALAGALPQGLHGRDLLDRDAPPRDYVFTARDRIDESLDRVRTVYDGRYRYIRNFLPAQPHLIDRAYYDRTNPVRGLMRDLHAAGKLAPQQARVFDPQRPPEELYNLHSDPAEFMNLAGSSDPAVQAKLAELRGALARWIVETGDMGDQPEEPGAMDIGGGPGGRKSRKAGNAAGTEPQGAAQPVLPQPAAEPLVLAAAGQLFAGGQLVQVAGGGRRGAGESSTTLIEQAPVHYLIPQEQRFDTPVLMLPGHGLTSYLYLATPDGREGWAQRFARHGYAVYVMDIPNYAVSGIDPRPFTAVREGHTDPATLPGLTVWPNESIWRTWGFGPEAGVPFADAQYPVQYIDQLYASFTAVTGGSGARKDPAAGTAGPAADRRKKGSKAGTPRQDGGDRFGGSRTAVAAASLLEQTGPAALIVHSAAGAASVAILQARAELVTAVIMVEPAGSPTDPALVEELLADKPYLAVFGDHFEVRGMQGRYEACLETARLIVANGGRAEVLRLPDLGVRGNSHLLMQDRNSHEIAARVLAWLEDG